MMGGKFHSLRQSIGPGHGYVYFLKRALAKWVSFLSAIEGLRKPPNKFRETLEVV
jgi:hypothetical protein